MRYLALRFYSNHVAAFHHYLIHGFVQHVGASIDCTQSKMTSKYERLNRRVDFCSSVFTIEEKLKIQTWQIPAAALPDHTGGRGRGSSHTGPEIHCTA